MLGDMVMIGSRKVLCMVSAILIVFGLLATAGSAAYVFVDSFGTDGTGPGQFRSPSGVAVDAAGNVYVSDTNNHRIQVFDMYGTFKRQFGSSGSTAGRFAFPHGIAIDSAGYIYVADKDNHRLQVFDAGGTYKYSLGSFGYSPEGQYVQPEGVAINKTHLYVSSTGNKFIHVYTRSGTQFEHTGWWGGSAVFKDPVGIAIKNSGNVFVMDRGDSKIRQFTDSGSLIDTISLSGNGIAIDEADLLYIADYNSNQIIRLDLNGGQLTFGSDELKEPRDVACKIVGKTGRTPYVYVADTKNHRIAIFAPEGMPVFPEANFTYTSLTSEHSPHIVQFNDTSCRVDTSLSETAWEWFYKGNGGEWHLFHTAHQASDNFSYVFDQVGTYSIKLAVTNSEGTSTCIKENSITVIKAPEIYFEPDHIITVPDRDHTFSLYLRIPQGQIPNDLSGFNITLKSDVDDLQSNKLNIVDITFPSWVELETVSSLPHTEAICRAIDLDGLSGKQTLHLLDVHLDTTSRADNFTVTVTNHEVEDRQGELYRPALIPSTMEVRERLPFPNPAGGFFNHQQSLSPGNPGHQFNDLDGNGRLNFNDIVIYYNNMQAIQRGDHGRIHFYDYDDNTHIGFNDIMILNNWVG